MKNGIPGFGRHMTEPGDFFCITSLMSERSMKHLARISAMSVVGGAVYIGRDDTNNTYEFTCFIKEIAMKVKLLPVLSATISGK